MFYGLIFGFFDVEDAKSNILELKLIVDEYYCLPIAGFLGFIGGIVNEYLRMKGDFFMFELDKFSCSS